MENPIKMDDLGGSIIFGNAHNRNAAETVPSPSTIVFGSSPRRWRVQVPLAAIACPNPWRCGADGGMQWYPSREAWWVQVFFSTFRASYVKCPFTCQICCGYFFRHGRCLFGCLIVWLFVCFVCLFGWLVGWSVGWLGCVVLCLVWFGLVWFGCLFVRLFLRLFDCLFVSFSVVFCFQSFLIAKKKRCICLSSFGHAMFSCLVLWGRWKSDPQVTKR